MGDYAAAIVPRRGRPRHDDYRVRDDVDTPGLLDDATVEIARSLNDGREAAA
jgi:hypothetical protein